MVSNVSSNNKSINDELNRLAKMAEEILRGQEFFVSAVLDRIQEAKVRMPHDQAIRSAEQILRNRFNKQGSLATISQAEFQNIYKDVGGLGNRTAFREYLGEYMLNDPSIRTAHYNEAHIAGLRDGQDSIDIVDPNLMEELGGLFGSSKVSSKSFIDNGRRGLELELVSMGFKNSTVEVLDRTADFVVYATTIPSSYGNISAYIPAEIKAGSVLMPSVFVSGSNFVELNYHNLMAHAQMVAMGKRTASAHEILGALSKTADIGMPIVSIAGDDHIHLDTPNFYQTEIDNRPQMLDFETPQVTMPKALEHLTENAITDTLIEAGLSFDRNIVVAAKQLVANEIRSMGIYLDKVSVASEFDGGIMICANIRGSGGTKTIEVPVEISAYGSILMPSVFSSGTHVDSFDQNKLQAFAGQKIEGIFDAAFSNKLGWDFKKLHNHALSCAAYGKFVEAEETLAVIAQHYGDEFHKIAFTDLVELLNVGVQEEEKPLDVMEKYMKEASAKAADKENNIRMSSNLMYMYPND